MCHPKMKTSQGYTLGPIPIPRHRQVAQNLFRIFSIKAGMRIVTCESALEADFVYAFEGDPKYTWICEQPIRIDRPIGKKPWCTLDIAVRSQVGEQTFYEVKPTASLVTGPDSIPKPRDWGRIEEACLEHGLKVGFLTELDIENKQTTIANWRALLPFAVQAYEDPDHEFATHLIDLASAGAGICIGDAYKAAPNLARRTVVAHLAMLLHHGSLRAPLHIERISPSMVVRGALDEAA